jgi:hypothetical protein
MTTKAQWANHIRDQAACGETVADYCQRHGLVVSTFYMQRANTRSQATATRADFRALTDAPVTPMPAPITLWCAGIRIDVAPQFDPAHLRAIVQALA